MEFTKSRKKSAGKRFWTAFGVIILIIVMIAAIYVAFLPNDIFPSFMETKVFPVETANMAEALPKGSMAYVEKLSLPAPGDVAAYIDSGIIECARVATETQSDYTLAFDKGGDSFKIDRKKIIGTVTFYSDNIGYIVMWLNTYRIAIAALGAVLIIAAICFGATASRRKRSRENRQLREMFDFYGEKYDEEENEIDY